MLSSEASNLIKNQPLPQPQPQPQIQHQAQVQLVCFTHAPCCWHCKGFFLQFFPGVTFTCTFQATMKPVEMFREKVVNQYITYSVGEVDFWNLFFGVAEMIIKERVKHITAPHGIHNWVLNFNRNHLFYGGLDCCRLCSHDSLELSTPSSMQLQLQRAREGGKFKIPF